MSIDDIYTPLEEAREEIQRRWNDPVLRKKVEVFLGHEHLPSYIFEKPHAISIEDVATPNLYCMTFVNRAKEAGLDPLHFEYLEDTFITTNIDKASLAKMTFYHGLDNHGDMIKSIERLIDLKCEEKKKIKEIKTLTGEYLVDLHHRLFLNSFPEAKIFDGSNWFASKGGSAKKYYVHVLSMTICHGVLFDNFLDYDYFEADLVKNILFPAIEEVEEMFGFKPLIVSVAPTHKVLEKFWWSYPEFIKMLLKK